MASGDGGGTWRGKGNDDGGELKIAKLVFDRHNLKILIATWNRSATPGEISRKFGVPIGSVYRRIHRLEREGLLRPDGTRHASNGKNETLYRAMLKSLQVQVAGRHMTVWVRADDARAL